jgi:uncharacterized iron-regulated membrane protein
VSLHHPEKPEKPVQVRAKFPNDPMPNGRTYVYLDPYTGKVLQLDHAFKTSPASLISKFNYTFHTGDIAGLPGRILWTTAALTLPVLFVSGVLIWRGRGAGAKRQKPARRMAPPPVDPPQPRRLGAGPRRLSAGSKVGSEL